MLNSSNLLMMLLTETCKTTPWVRSFVYPLDNIEPNDTGSLLSRGPRPAKKTNKNALAQTRNPNTCHRTARLPVRAVTLYLTEQLNLGNAENEGTTHNQECGVEGRFFCGPLFFSRSEPLRRVNIA